MEKGPVKLQYEQERILYGYDPRVSLLIITSELDQYNEENVKIRDQLVQLTFFSHKKDHKFYPIECTRTNLQTLVIIGYFLNICFKKNKSYSASVYHNFSKKKKRK